MVNSLASTAGNNNGGALYFTAVGELSVSVSGSHLLDNSQYSDANTAFTFNANGGAAIYAYSNISVTAAFMSIAVESNTVSCLDSVVNTTTAHGVGNFNGGAIYLYSNGGANVNLMACELSNNALQTPNAVSRARFGNNNGGAAMFAYATKDMAVTIATTTVRGNSMFSNYRLNQQVR